MIRTVVKPNRQKISIELPKDFVGKQVEVIAFTVEEADVAMSIADKPLTHLASEKLLAKDWLSSEEDMAWQNL